MSSAIVFPETLPITQHVAKIQALLKQHRVLIVAGDTGSGKSTQLPKICLAAGYGQKGLIGHTQPRRLAARAVASRVAEELGVPLGTVVGYQVRFHEQVTESTRIKVMTDGILLNEIQFDRWLTRYEVIIVDEAHERTLNIDFILGHLKKCLAKRADLKVIVTSATIDTERFAAFFEGAPVVKVEGRTYPVEIRYLPPIDEQQKSLPLEQSIRGALDHLFSIRYGDVLVFLSTEKDIHDVAEGLKHYDPRVEVLKLYARLSLVAQQKVFHPKSGKVRVILTTNVAETSLTVPNIRYVIDAGTARISRYSPQSKVQRLPIEPISQASANQRAGRCGRLGPGVCIRLYDKADFLQREAYTSPEILRTSLAGVILQLLANRLGRIENFPFLTPPEGKAIRAGYQLLFEIGALDTAEKLTAIGQQIAKLPLDPGFARIVLAGHDRQVLYDSLVIIAALSIQDPRERPADQQQKADMAHAKWRHPHSDFLSQLWLFEDTREQAQQLTRRQFKEYCETHFLSQQRLQEWQDLFSQLKQLCVERHWPVSRQSGWYFQGVEKGLEKSSPTDAHYRKLHEALLTGFPTQVGVWDEKEKQYEGTRQLKFQLFPGSGLRKVRPRWVLGAELIETSARYLHKVAAIEPAWLEKQVPHLVKRRYDHPHWFDQAGRVYAFEQVSLYGLVLQAKRRVYFGQVDPQAAREVFIREALAVGLCDQDVFFTRENRQLLAKLQVLEAKLRRRDCVLDEAGLADFYQQVLPAGIADRKTLKSWWAGLPRNERQPLFLTEAQALVYLPEQVDLSRYPDMLKLPTCELPLVYQFAPEDEADGITIQVPLAVLPQLTQSLLDWCIPAWLEERILLYIRALPKPIRRHCIPAPDMAKRCAERLQVAWQQGSFTDHLATVLAKLSGQPIRTEHFEEVELPAWQQFNIQVFNTKGEVMAESRDCAALQKALAKQAEQALTANMQVPVDKTLYRSWSFSDLPEAITQSQHGVQFESYPTLIVEKEGQGVVLREFSALEQAKALHTEGVLCLLQLAFPQFSQKLKKRIPKFEQMALFFSPFGSAGQLEAALVKQLFRLTFAKDEDLWAIRSPNAFAKLSEKQVALAENCQYLGQLFQEVLQQACAVREGLKKLRQELSLLASLQDLQAQYAALCQPQFLANTPLNWLVRYPIYFKGMLLRLERLLQNPQKDRLLLQQYQPMAARLDTLTGEKAKTYFWLLQEYRLSLFSQPLKTCVSISEKLLNRYV